MADSLGFKIDIGYRNSVVSGQGEYGEGDRITFRCTPNDHYIFVNWELVLTQTDELVLEEPKEMSGDDYLRRHEENESIILSTDSTFVYNSGTGSLFEDGNTYYVIANVRPRDIYKITVQSEYGTPYISTNYVEEGQSVTIRAREYNGVTFTHWSDGSVEIERTFVPSANLTLVAYYTIIDTTVSLYQYRGFIKDSRYLNALPKAFVIATSFVIREDLLATANSTINVLYVPSNVNNGDVLVLYSPKGKVMYKGVIEQIESNTIQCSQIQSLFKGLWLAENNGSNTIETQFKTILDKYCGGFIGNSPYKDTLVEQKFSSIPRKVSTSTNGALETYEPQKTINMTDLIYQMYEKYGMILDVTIPYGEWNIGDDNGGSVDISIPNYQEIKVGDNANCITSMSPTTEIEETNKLVIFAKNGNYRATYYATTTNGIVKEPPTDVGRFNVVNTKIVFSDDPETTIIESNLPQVMFNHFLSFDMLLSNKLYDWYSWKLGQPLHVWNGSDFYSTIYTGYELTKEENANPTYVRVECGKVRLTLTKKLSLMGV